MNPRVLAQPSFQALLDLVPFFEPRTGVPEAMNQTKVDKMRRFVEVVVDSGPMQPLIALMRKTGHPFVKDKATMLRSMYSLWFDMFPRVGSRPDSSAFEHVFIGEEHKGQVAGMHNWAVISKLENDNAKPLNYRGFIVKRAVSATMN